VVRQRVSGRAPGKEVVGRSEGVEPGGGRAANPFHRLGSIFGYWRSGTPSWYSEKAYTRDPENTNKKQKKKNKKQKKKKNAPLPPHRKKKKNKFLKKERGRSPEYFVPKELHGI
jgi:hypothetical protein